MRETSIHSKGLLVNRQAAGMKGGGITATGKNNMKTISPGELTELMNSDALCADFDVRERGEFNNGQIPNSTSLPRSQIEFRIAELVPNKKITIVLYDDNGERARRAARTLAECGYSDVAVLDGGLPAWQLAG